ncbi:fibronectin type III domain-containing protein [Flavobacterium piscis]|uniref:Fibronectin type-III domain-containing protein n=1 Tax=Flavobacterium piscis TaxID=1114874 RepID=A0ABU1YDR3_9FLAO|nr:fibronectin type III domain-containing protein [Flavobacterium piscis]MDR7212238.1 hypothetical protein [Flavobacterium piscis]
MKNFYKNIILFILFPLWGLGGFGCGAYAQLYPVQLTPVFNSPYSVKISDYATSMDTKMQLLVNPTDISISQRQVRLKLYIQGNGLNIQSSDFIQGQRPIFINGGELQTLTNTDIAALFRLENLQGISPAQYANGLSEGMYSFCFEMYDFVTNQKISQKSCASLYLILNDPPILNTPQRNEQIAATEFPNILFTWTPRQRNATNVSYKFELKQLFDPTLDPQFAFQMSPVLYEETLFGTALLYNVSMPILTPGLRYAWRVKAISTTGLSENAVFKNDGYSEIYSFKYTASCAAPTFLLSESQSSKSVKITWEGVPEHTRYQVQYKKQDVRNAQWFSTNSLNTQSLITNLEPGVTYQFRVGSSCDPAAEGVQSFTYSGISIFTIPTETNGVSGYNCGIIPKVNIQNQTPIVNLLIGEIFTAGDFPVRITDLTGSGDQYSGRGVVDVPYLENLKLSVLFDNITINTNYQLIRGVVETAYDSSWKNVITIDPLIEEIFGPQSGSKDITDVNIDSSTDGNNDSENTDEPNGTDAGTINTDTNPKGTGEPTDTENPNADAGSGTEPAITENNSGSTTDNNSNETSGKGYFIEYKNKKYYTGDKIQIPFNRNGLISHRFRMKELEKETNVKYELSYQSEQGVRFENVGGNNYLKKIESKDVADFEFSFDNALKYQLKSIADIEKKPSLLNEINLVVKPFKITSLKAIDSSNTNRVAVNGQTLYYINKTTMSKESKKTKFEISFTPNLPIDEIPKKSIKWKFNDTYYEKKDGMKSLSYIVNESKNIDVNVISGYPTESNNSVNVKWVDEGFKKHNLKFDAGFDLMDKLKELAQKLGVPVYQEKGKYATDNKFSVLADAAYTTEFRNKADLKSRLVYEEKKEIFSATVGVKGSFEKGIPSLSLPTVKKTYLGEDFEFSLGIYFFIEGTSIGQIGHTKYTENWIEEGQKRNRTYKEIGNPSKVIISAKIGLDPRVSFKASDYVSAKVSGKSFAEAQLYIADLYKNEFYSPILTEGFKLKCTPVAFIKIWKFSYDCQWDEYEYQVKW